MAQNESLTQELLSLADEDRRVRDALAADGSLYDGYSPDMEAVHNRNADRLVAVIQEWGWPGKSLVGSEGATAAWLILQHAIGKPDLQRKCLPLLQDLAAKGEVNPQEVAMLEDRIRVFEGKPQRYGTQFDWDEGGEMSPLPIDQPEQVDELRRQVGLPLLSETIERHRARVEKSGEKPPVDFAERQRQAEAWCRKVGWRNT